MLYTDNLRSARATDVYALDGSGSEFYRPRFTYHGFRYVELTGFPGTPTLSTIVGQVVHDAVEEHADFVTSNDLLNQIYKNVLWGTRGNYRSIPTDCPQRDERQGWQGDRSSESKGEAFMFDVSAFYTKWVADIEDTMTAEGALDDVAPGYWTFYKDNVTWPATFIIVAAAMHEQYGDRRIIQAHYPAMKRWIDHMSKQLKDDLMPCDTYGDWCVPPESLELIHSKDPARQTGAEVLGSTYFYYLLRTMSRFAAIAGSSDDQKEFEALSSRIKAAFNAKYFHPEQDNYANGSQTSSVLPLAFRMVPEDHKHGVINALVQNIEVKTDGHIGTGLIGAQWIMRTLSDNGYPDIAYKIATQQTYPSWGYMISKGATTIWELWNGDTAAPGMNSMNHLMLVGDLVIWLYENLAGIRADPNNPGFKHIIIHPTVTGDLKFVQASHNSPYGRIMAKWQLDADQFSLNVDIPVNATATVYVPTKAREQVREGGYDTKHSKGLRFLRMESGSAVYEVGSGNYAFTSPL
jgi:alpha-L-rhamnosidase